jgi:uncharacterized protein (TIGR02246 family)
MLTGNFNRLAVVGIASVWLAMLVSLSIAVEQPGGDKEQEDAIREAGKAYVRALHSGDAMALAQKWTAEGTYTDATGRSFQARELIKQAFGQAVTAETSAPIIVDTASSIRFVTPDVAIERGTYPALPAEGVAAGHYVATWVKTDQGWLLDNLSEHQTPSDLDANPMDALRWMIGHWVGQGDDVSVTFSAHWSENKKFIVRRILIEQAGQRLMSSTQRIGWDPGKRRIRSWSFRSDGAVAEGGWLEEGGSWIVRTTGVLPDGVRLSAVNFWLREGDDHLVLKSSHGKVGDVEVDDSVVEFRRVASVDESFRGSDPVPEPR